MHSLLDQVSTNLSSVRDRIRESVRLRLLRGTADLINWLESLHNRMAPTEFERPSRHARFLADRHARGVRCWGRRSLWRQLAHRGLEHQARLPMPRRRL